MKETTLIDTYEEKRKRISDFNLVSDLFAGKVFEDVESCQELCRILLKNDNIVIKKVRTQYMIRNLENHSVSLDILAEDLDGNLINTEIQMYEEPAPLKRSRYYISSIDMSILEKGVPYNKLPDVTMIYITKEDFIGNKQGSYSICRMSDEHNTTIGMDNGLHEKYYNLEYPTDDIVINELLQYFENSDPFYHTENFPRIVERVHYFKIQNEGVDIMCEIADRIRKEGRIAGRIESKIEDILELLGDLGKVPQKILECINQETDLDILSKWLKYAAKATSIAEFESNM